MLAPSELSPAPDTPQKSLKNSRYTPQADSGYESEYETEDGTKLHPGDVMAKGQFAKVRPLGSDRVVLHPHTLNEEAQAEVKAKLAFFEALYPEKDVQLFSFENTYRLVLPLIEGVLFKNFKNVALTEQGQIKLFLSAVQALIHCHSKNLVVIDFKDDNIFYDFKTGKSYLIDGGLSAQIGEPLAQQFHQQTEIDVLRMRQASIQYAPECVSLATNPTPASEAMDVYALGICMKYLYYFKNKSGIPDLYKACSSLSAENRPILKELESSLISMLPKQFELRLLPGDFEDMGCLAAYFEPPAPVKIVPQLPVRPPLLVFPFTLSKTAHCVFIIFTEKAKAEHFVALHDKHIYALWDDHLQAPLPKLDEKRIPGAFVVRIPIEFYLPVNKASYTYAQFCKDAQLALPPLDAIPVEPSKFERNTRCTPEQLQFLVKLNKMVKSYKSSSINLFNQDSLDSRQLIQALESGLSVKSSCDIAKQLASCITQYIETRYRANNFKTNKVITLLVEFKIINSQDLHAIKQRVRLDDAFIAEDNWTDIPK